MTKYPTDAVKSQITNKSQIPITNDPKEPTGSLTAFVGHWFTKVRKKFQIFLCPTDGKTTNGFKSFGFT